MNLSFTKTCLYFLAGAAPQAKDIEIGKELMRKLEASVKFRNGMADDGGKPEECDFVYGNTIPEQRDSNGELVSGERSTIPPRYAERFPVVSETGNVVSEPLKVATFRDTDEQAVVSGGDALEDEIGSAKAMGSQGTGEPLSGAAWQ